VNAGQALIAELAAEVGAGLRQQPKVTGWAGRAKRTGWSGCGVVGERDVGGGEVLYRVALFVDYGNGDRDGMPAGASPRGQRRRGGCGRLGWGVAGKEVNAAGQPQGGKGECWWNLHGASVSFDQPLDVSTGEGFRRPNSPAAPDEVVRGKRPARR